MRSSNEIFEDANYFGAKSGYHNMTTRGDGNFRVFSFTTNGRVKKDKDWPMHVG